MATNKQKSVEIIEGEVTQAFSPSKTDAGTWRPANIYIETAEGKVKISEFPKSDFETRITHEPIQMAAWYTALDLDNLAGAKVQVAASYKSTWEDIREYNKIQTFKVLSSLPTPQPSKSPATASAPATASWGGSIDERIAWNSSINNANEATDPPTNAEDEARWIEDIDRRAHLIYPLIRRGPTPPVEIAPEGPVEAQEPDVDLPVDPLDGEAPPLGDLDEPAPEVFEV